MSTTEKISTVDEESSPISLSQCYPKTVSAPPGEASSSTLIAVDSRHQALSGAIAGPAHVADISR
jgi:hypothetical protein